MINRFSKALATAVSAAMLCSGLSSCADWIQAESVALDNPSIEKQNPELWNAYLESLREYRQSEHKVMIVEFDNRPDPVVGEADHLRSLPDSTDFVIMMNPDNLL